VGSSINRQHFASAFMCHVGHGICGCGGVDR
jgi:hypothetical protein